jgi:mevalonate kinase
MEHKYLVVVPSKVLLVGGYAILKEGCFGVSLALEKCFYSRLKVSSS